MTYTIGIDIGSGVVKTTLFRTEGDRHEWLAKRSERIRRRDPMTLAQEGHDGVLADAGLAKEDVDYIATTGEGLIELPLEFVDPATIGVERGMSRIKVDGLGEISECLLQLILLVASNAPHVVRKRVAWVETDCLIAISDGLIELNFCNVDASPRPITSCLSARIVRSETDGLIIIS
jgi:hypothetical protein